MFETWCRDLSARSKTANNPVTLEEEVRLLCEVVYQQKQSIDRLTKLLVAKGVIDAADVVECG